MSTSSTTLTLLPTGYCTQSSWLVLRTRHRTMRFPALVALIEHPQHGPILFDTGYSERFFAATERWPFRLYRWLTPVFISPEETVVAQLARRGIAAADVRTIILSHFHADHMCGLLDFPQAQFICFEDAYRSIEGKQGLAAAQAAYLPDLLPKNFANRARMIGNPSSTATSTLLSPAYAPFRHGVDLFGDGSLIAVCVPGHARGQMGLFVKTFDSEANNSEIFLAADAVWHSQAIRQQILPHPIARLIFADWGDYTKSFNQVCQLQRNRPELPIIPYHCEEVYGKLRDEG